MYTPPTASLLLFQITGIVAKTGASLKFMSNFTEEGVIDVKTSACDVLLSKRVEAKMKTRKAGDMLNRLTIVEPKPRDGKARTVTIPESVVREREAKAKAAVASAAAAAARRALGGGFDEDDDEVDDDDEGMGGAASSSSSAFHSSAAAAAAASRRRRGVAASRDDDEDGEDEGFDAAALRENKGGAPIVRKWLARDKEKAGGGPGVYKADTAQEWLLRDDDWKTDIVPEMMEGE